MPVLTESLHTKKTQKQKKNTTIIPADLVQKASLKMVDAYMHIKW